MNPTRPRLWAPTGPRRLPPPPPPLATAPTSPAARPRPGSRRPAGWVARVWAVALPLAACGATPRADGGGEAKSAKVTADRPLLRQLSAQEEASIRRLLPGAAQLQASELPAEKLDPADQDNHTLFTARGPDGSIVGWARPMAGPVTAHESCPCSPLVLTLVFDSAYTLLDIVAPAPLNKWGHQPLSAEEHRRLVAIANQPPAELLNLPEPEALVELESGATRHAFAQAVVPQAALSTHRISTWVAQTRALIKGDPLGAERQKVFAVLRREPQAGAAAVDLELAAMLPTLTSQVLQGQVFSLLANRYRLAAADGGGDNAKLEAALLAPGLPAASEASQIAKMCGDFAREGLRLGMVKRCLGVLDGRGVPPAYLSILRGAERFAAGDHVAALPALQEAASILRPHDAPRLYLQLAQAAAAVGQRKLSCSTCELLYPDQPKLPGLAETMQPCRAADGSHDTFMAGLEAQAKAALLRQARPTGGPQAGALSVTTLAGAPTQLPLGVPGHITVAMFFATWCPHCRAELPRISAFARAVQQDPALQGRVQIVGVRTATHQEFEPVEQFIAQMQPTFPIYTDPDSGASFTAFARGQNLPLALPTLAVLDADARLRFVMAPGDHRDTAQELRWAVESLL